MELERGLLRFKLFLSTPSARRATSASAGRKCPGSDFYPRPPRGGRHSSGVPGAKQFLFLSTPSARRATGQFSTMAYRLANFYPRPPRGGRRHPGTGQEGCHGISIHALREEGDNVSELPAGAIEVFLSTPSARRATAQYAASHGQRGISIHALREEGDASASSTSTAPQRFLSTPSARRATEETNTVVWMNGFLSTPSARRATSAGRSWCPPHSYFYPRPPRGGRP
mgnify:CR=1 FL=1